MGDRAADWLAVIDPAVEGLEIGPLDKPRLARDRYRVRYVDHADQATLRTKYADDAAMRDHLDEIVEVDFVWTGEKPLAEVVGAAGPFGYVFASHVVEHAPDLIGWLGQLSEVLVPGGVIALAVPDKRYCFDVNRAVTTMADVVDAHLRGLTAPGYRQIYDFHSRIVAVDAAEAWAGRDYSGVERTDLDPDGWAYELCLQHRDTGEYVDGHCQVFTPASFLDLLERLSALDLVDLAVADFRPTQPGSIEFQVVLERLDPDLEPAVRRARQLRAVIEARRSLAEGSGAAEGAAPLLLEVSPLEQRLVEAKRTGMHLARVGLGRARRLAGRLRASGA